ncbi:SpoIIE family protein phosphatase [Asanoa iriomotensis]|uniref:Transcription antitermination regulator n=1 Tax=Asanoa iriomotensis TaxID=234613 RepID=A0ABQ4BZI1_9ACTN|nr:SpoIIE family protein phosphatase [Asanoa iriomotensis]GIF55920.1 transcription antitermination regulator [Asanoa iriomotensis]
MPDNRMDPGGDGPLAALVDAAVSVLAERLECSLEEARQRLRGLAERSGVSEPEAAAAVLDSSRTPASTAPFDEVRRMASAAAAEAARMAARAVAAPGREPLADLAGTLREHLAHEVGADAVAVYAAEPDASLQLVGAAGVPPAVVDAWSRVPAHPPTEAGYVARTRDPLFLPDRTATPPHYLLVGGPGAEWPSRAVVPVGDGNAVAVVVAFFVKQQPFPAPVRAAVTRIVDEVAGEVVERLRAHPHQAGWITDAQSMLDALPGAVGVSVPIRDANGTIVDWVLVAASPEATDVTGLRGQELVGTSTATSYPTLVGTELWHSLTQVFESGRPREIGPFTYTPQSPGIETAVFTVRISQFGGGVLLTWTRLDEERRLAARIAQTERLGRLGWGEWDLTTGSVYWSEGLYAIFRRDPESGPPTLEEATSQLHPQDAPRIAPQLARVFEHGQAADLNFRILVGARERHLRARFETIRDRTGGVLKVYGIIQDVTAREAAARDRARLVDIEAELAERLRSQQTEHRLVVALQQIILPIPTGVLHLPGLDVAVRYLPAEVTSRVGGDWYDVVELPDGRSLLAVGDVAGHGITAAATMARLRHSVAALAVTSTEPGELLGFLNRIVHDDASEPTATVVVAHFDPETRELTWAQAGHPPPILVSGGTASALTRPPGMIVGARPDSTYETVTTTLAEGDTVLLYTDGLIERRGGYDSDWLGPLLRTVAGAGQVPVDRLIARLQPANPGDDTCVLALRPA